MIVNIIDIEIDIDLINITKVARKANLSQPYVNQLLDPNDPRKNKDSLRRVRNAIIALYGSIVKKKAA